MNNNFNKINKETLDAARKGDTDALLSNLSEEERKKLEETLADKEKIKTLLNSDTAKMLMKLLGGKQNG